MHELGVVAKVVQNLQLPNGNVKVLVEGMLRASAIDLREEDEHLGRRHRDVHR